jgi:hypothetical protein
VQLDQQEQPVLLQQLLVLQDLLAREVQQEQPVLLGCPAQQVQLVQPALKV